MAQNEFSKSHIVLAVFDVTELKIKDGCYILSAKFSLIDKLLESAVSPVVLLNKTDLLNKKDLALNKLQLKSGRTLEVNLVSLKSE